MLYMKRTSCLLVPLFFILLSAQARTARPVIKDPSATFDSIWVDYDVKENDQTGMRIHLQFTTYNMKNMESYVAVYFSYNDEIAGVLKDKNNKYM